MPRPSAPTLAALAAAALALAGLPPAVHAERTAPLRPAEPFAALYDGDPPPHPLDAFWVPMAIPPFDATPQALAAHAGHLVLAGDFGSLGTQRLQRVAEWDGSQFSDIGLLDPVSVHAATDWNGALVVGGPSATAPNGSIQRRNGAIWEQLATTNGDVTALGTWNGDLVAAGRFTVIGGVAANRVARFDGSAWHAMASGHQFSSSVTQLLQYGPDLYAGGSFNASPVHGVERWDGVQWTIPGVLYGFVSSLVTDGVALYAGGNFQQGSFGCARWDGAAWYRAGNETDYVGSLAFWNGSLYGTVRNGTSRVSRLDAGIWSGTGDALPSAPTFLEVADGKLVAVGQFIQAGDISNLHVYDGTAWTRAGPSPASGMSGIDGTTYAVTLANDKLCIAGTDVRTFNDGLALPAGFASAWNGTSWSPLGSFVGGWGAVLGTSGTDIIVAGEVYIGGDAPSNIARWNGTLWQKIGPYSFWQTHAIAEHQGSLYAGGGPSLETLGRVARLNGSAWESVGGGVGTGSDSVSALASWNDLLVAGGSFGTAGGVPVANVASWNGSAWSPLGAGLDGVTLTFAALGADLVAGGTFTHAGGEPASGVARWDGAAWHAMGTRCVDIRDFAQVDGVLYAAGHFRDADDLVRQTVARWTGTEWDLMGSGVPQGYDILWVEGYHGDLYAGGDFRHAFGNVSAFITRLPAVNTVAVEDRAHAPLALAASPNPGRGGTTFAFTLPVRGHVRLAVFDAAGREVARVLDDDVLAGAHEARWTAAARPGVYFARLDAPGGASRVARVVRLD